jgi:hypothetical protein
VLITVTDQMLKAGGLAHDAESAAAGFKAFCQAWRDGHQDEPEPLFVHVGQEVWDGQDAPPVVPELLDDYDPHAPRPAFSLRVIATSSDSTTDEDRRRHQLVLPDLGGQAAAFVGAMPASLEEVEQHRLEQQRAALMPPPLAVLGLRLPEDGRGVLGYQVIEAARALGCRGTLVPGGVHLEGPFGSGTYSIAGACRALMQRAYNPT